MKNSAASQDADRLVLNALYPHQCKLRDVYDMTDVDASASIRSFIDTRAIRKVVLNTSYTLCDGTPNSFASAITPPFIDQPATTANRGGKLTLNSISYFGPGNQKVVPDIKFEYNSPNPVYHKDAWDGWGSYNSNSITSHSHTATSLSDPTVWHLTDIISSLGGRITVAYESDEYSSISGEPVRQSVPITRMQNVTSTEGRLEFDIRNIAPYTLLDFTQNGASVSLTSLQAQQQRKCWEPGSEWYNEEPYNISPNQMVRGLSTNSFLIDKPSYRSGWADWPWDYRGCTEGWLYSITGTLEFLFPKKKGGGVRVSSITTSDGQNSYTTAYRYTQNGTLNGVSSGCVAQEPELVRTTHYPFYDWYDYPNTPVLYGKVTVINGVRNANEYNSKTEYSFRSPEAADMTVNETMLINDSFNWPYGVRSHVKTSKVFNFNVENFSSRIGRLEKIQILDRSGIAVASTKMEYADHIPGDLGTFTSGSVLCEVQQEGDQDSDIHFKASRTTKTSHPNILTAIHSTTNGVMTSRYNRAWDFLTGVAIITETANSWGETYRSQTELAYEKYAAMRSKAENSANLHMLLQPASNTTYKLDASSNPTQVVAASAQTWSSQWPHRSYNATTDQYNSTGTPSPRWRQQASYEWLNRRVNTNGLTPLAAYTAFSWLTPSPPANWVQAGQTMLYNSYSAPLEARSISGTRSATKIGYNQSLTLIEANNAGYGEIAYSGAEDVLEVVPGVRHFEGEVRGGQFQSSDKAHTGQYSLKLTSGQQGFVVKSQVGVTGGVEAGREYKASVWLHESDLATAGGRLFARLDNGVGNTTLEDIDIRDRTTKRAGEWRLLDLYFTVPIGTPTGRTLQIGCENVGLGTTYFDDFRFHPVDAPATSYVYNLHTQERTHVLNEDNLYTRFEYDAAGRLRRTHLEVLNDQVSDRVVSSTVVNYARNATFTIGTSVENPAQGNLSANGITQVLMGEGAIFTATGVNCTWKPSSQFDYDGITYNAVKAPTASDPTSVRFNSTDGTFKVSNVTNNHSLLIRFVHYNFPAAGTPEEIDCEWDGNCRTGYMLMHNADGCGGYGPEYRQWANADCPFRTPGCP